MDLVFQDAIYWFFMNHTITTLVFGSLSALALFIGFFFVIRKWGDI